MFIIVDGQPVAKGRPKVSFKAKRVYTPPKTVEHEKHIRNCFYRSGPHEPIEGPIRLTITFSMQIPKSWSMGKKHSAEIGMTRPIGTPDLDNLIKMIDALNGLAFKDDSQIVELFAVKKYGTPQTSILLEGIE